MTALFQPVQLGKFGLSNRIALAPMTRYRADDDHVPLPFMAEYYAQRASTPGTLLITEGTFISKRCGGFANAPGIWNQSQIIEWQKVTEAVHAKGCVIFCQLWALGRAANTDVLARDSLPLISSSDLPIPGTSTPPQPLDEAGIQAVIQDYVDAAKNAIEAGFDGVEIHGANGYLPDQFLQDKVNNRTDGWGGDIVKRARFGTEVAKAISASIGADRVGYRISPWSPFQGMKMDDPKPQFSQMTRNLKDIGLAYIHIVESRISGADTIEARSEQADFLLDIWGDSGAVILAGGFTPESAVESVAKYPNSKIIIGFGRHYLANPDLQFRIKHNLALNKYYRPTFYVPKDPVGYLDYPFSDAFKAQEVRN